MKPDQTKQHRKYTWAQQGVDDRHIIRGKRRRYNKCRAFVCRAFQEVCLDDGEFGIPEDRAIPVRRIDINGPRQRRRLARDTIMRKILLGEDAI